MRKTFKSVCVPGLELNISPSHQGIALTVTMDEELSESQGVTLSAEDAPALALAILEAAGVEPVNHSVTGLGKPNWLEGIAHSLKLHIEHEAKATAEAEAQAELEAEALELFNVRHGTDLDDWKHSDRSVVSAWVSVARKAREIGAEK